MAVLPQGAGFSSSLNHTDQPTNTFIIDWSARQISGMDSGLAAMRQVVEIILQNHRFQWQIYSSNFGSELQDLPGEDYDYIISEIPRRIQEAFSTDNRILSAENFAFGQNKDGNVECSFEVVTVFGTIREEVIL